MQNYAALLDELDEVREHIHCAGVEAVPSTEPWNPIAAVVLRSVELPRVISPQRVDMRIPIPNLYGFAVSVGMAILPVPLFEQLDTEQVPVPFCVPTNHGTLQSQMAYFVDVREHCEALLGGYSICVSQPTLPDRFQHERLCRIIEYMLDYLGSPTASVRQGLVEQQARLEAEGPSSFLLMSIAHAYEGLRDYSAAVQVLERATDLYPHVSALAKKIEQIRSLM